MGLKGYRHTAEARAKISARFKGQPKSPEARAKMSAAKLGRPLSPEHRAKLAAVRAGRTLSPEHRARIGDAHRGIPADPERIARMNAARRAKPRQPMTAEHRAKLSAARKGVDANWRASIKGECVYCFAPATTHDHVIPRGRPGSDAPDNIVPACRSCNSIKSDRTPDEWFAAMQGHVTRPRRTRGCAAPARAHEQGA